MALPTLKHLLGGSKQNHFPACVFLPENGYSLKKMNEKNDKKEIAP